MTQEQTIWIALVGEVFVYLLAFAFTFRTWRRERRSSVGWASSRTAPETDQKEYGVMTAKLPDELIQEEPRKLVETG